MASFALSFFESSTFQIAYQCSNLSGHFALFNSVMMTGHNVTQVYGGVKSYVHTLWAVEACPSDLPSTFVPPVTLARQARGEGGQARGPQAPAACSPKSCAALGYCRLSLSELADQLLRRMYPLGHRSPYCGPIPTLYLDQFLGGRQLLRIGHTTADLSQGNQPLIGIDESCRHLQTFQALRLQLKPSNIYVCIDNSYQF